MSGSQVLQVCWVDDLLMHSPFYCYPTQRQCEEKVLEQDRANKKKNHKYRTLHKLWKGKARTAKLQSGQVLEKECPGPQLSKIKLSSHPSKYFRISVLK